MKATAERDKKSANSVMAPVASRIIDAMLVVMQHYGIKKIECRKLMNAQFERTVAATEQFKDIPPEISMCGMLIKDCIAGILASAGVVEVAIDSTEEEDRKMSEGYRALVAAAKDATAGSCEIPKDGCGKGGCGCAKKVQGKSKPKPKAARKTKQKSTPPPSV